MKFKKLIPLCYDLRIKIKTNDFLKEINYFFVWPEKSWLLEETGCERLQTNGASVYVERSLMMHNSILFCSQHCDGINQCNISLLVNKIQMIG